MIREAAIADADFHKFRDYFYRKTGILFEDTKRYFVDKRLQERITATGHDSFREYFAFVRFEASGDELQHLTNAMTVNETYFFREEYQFQCMVGPMLDEITANKADRKPIRIWCMPSSTGEEAYSIALYLIEHWAGLADWDVEIIASDIDTDVLERAREGLFSARSVQYLPASLLDKHFTRAGGDRYRISDDLRESVQFTRVNLVDATQTRGYRDFDLVFCRNLLIYFDDASRRLAAASIFDALKPGGFVCLGHSESMSRISSLFRIRKFAQAIVYQKPGDSR